MNNGNLVMALLVRQGVTGENFIIFYLKMY